MEIVRSGDKDESLTVSTSNRVGLTLSGDDCIGEASDLIVGEFLDPASEFIIELARGSVCWKAGELL